MSVLHVFGDESGTMPRLDTDPPFVAATVASVMSPPSLEEVNKCRGNPFEAVARLSLIPFVAFVYPRPGFADALQKKNDKITTMVRADRLVTGTDSPFLSVDRLAAANILWTKVMTPSISSAVLLTLARAPVVRVDVCLDQKTMTPPMRKLFISTLHQVPSHIKNSLDRATPPDPRPLAILASRVMFGPADISVCWSDEPQAHASKGGLQLSHLLANRALKCLRTGGVAALERRFVHHGFDHTILDLTEAILAPIDREIVHDWMRRTGLPEPHL